MSEPTDLGPGMPGATWLQSDAARLAELERLVNAQALARTRSPGSRYDLGPMPAGWRVENGVVTIPAGGPGGAVAPGVREPFGAYGVEPEQDWFTRATGFSREWGTPPRLGGDYLAWNPERALYEPVHTERSRRDPMNAVGERQAFEMAQGGIYLQAYQDPGDPAGPWKFRYVRVDTPYPTAEQPYAFYKSAEEMRPPGPRDAALDPELARAMEGKTGQEAADARRAWLVGEFAKKEVPYLASAPGSYRLPDGRVANVYAPHERDVSKPDFSFEAWLRDPTLGGRIAGGAHLGANWNQPLVEQYKAERKAAGLPDLPPPTFVGFESVKERREKEQRKRAEQRAGQRAEAAETPEPEGQTEAEYWKEVEVQNAELHVGKAEDDLDTAKVRLEQFEKSHEGDKSPQAQAERERLQAAVKQAEKALAEARALRDKKAKALAGDGEGLPKAKAAGGSATSKKPQGADAGPVEVPHVEGTWAPQAQAALEGAGLTVTMEALKPPEGTTPGRVASQYPPGGSEVPAGSAVKLTVYTDEKMVTVPSITTLDTTSAENKLIAARLRGQKRTRPITSASQYGRVLDQTPPPNAQVLPRTVVHFTVGIRLINNALGSFGFKTPQESRLAWSSPASPAKGPRPPSPSRGRPQGPTDGRPRQKDSLEVPDLVGMTLADAIAFVGKSTPCVPTVRGGIGYRDATTVRVAAQSPAAGDEARGAGCEIVLVPEAETTGGHEGPSGDAPSPGPRPFDEPPPPPSVASTSTQDRRIPDLVGLTLEKAHGKAEQAGFFVTPDVEVGAGRRVLGQDPPPRDLRPPLTEIRVTVAAPGVTQERRAEPTPAAAKERPTRTVVQPRKVAVPNVMDMERYAAVATIQAAGLHPDIRDPYMGRSDTRVVEQVPPVGASAYQGAAVTVTLGLSTMFKTGIPYGPSVPFHPDIYASEGRVRVPDLISKTEDDARKSLQRVGLVAEVRPHGPDETRVTAQVPRAGDEVATGSTVAITLGRSSYAAPTPVPDVVGLDIADAVEALEVAGFLGAPDPQPRFGPVDLVVEQSPVAGTPSRFGTQVRCAFAQGVVVPDLRGMPATVARRTLHSIGLQSSFASGPLDGDVAHQSKATGTRVELGQMVALTLERSRRVVGGVVDPCTGLDEIERISDTASRYRAMYEFATPLRDAHGFSLVEGLPAMPSDLSEVMWSIEELAARLTEYCSTPSWELDLCGRAKAKALVIAMRHASAMEGLRARTQFARANVTLGLTSLWARHKMLDEHQAILQGRSPTSQDEWFENFAVQDAKALLHFALNILDRLPTGSSSDCTSAMSQMRQLDITLDCVSVVLSAFDLSVQLAAAANGAFQRDEVYRQLFLERVVGYDNALRVVTRLALTGGMDPGPALAALEAVRSDAKEFTRVYQVAEPIARALEKFAQEVILWVVGAKIAVTVVRGAFWLAAGTTRASIEAAVHLTTRVVARRALAGQLRLGEGLVKGTWTLSNLTRFGRLMSGARHVLGAGKNFRFPAAVVVPKAAAQQMLTTPVVGPLTILKRIFGNRWMPPGWALDLSAGRWVPVPGTSFGHKAMMYFVDGPGTYVLVDIGFDAGIAGAAYLLYELSDDD